MSVPATAAGGLTIVSVSSLLYATQDKETKNSVLPKHTEHIYCINSIGKSLFYSLNTSDYDEFI